MTIRFGSDTEELKEAGKGKHVRDAIKVNIVKAQQKSVKSGSHSLLGVLKDMYQGEKDEREIKEIVSLRTCFLFISHDGRQVSRFRRRSSGDPARTRSCCTWRI